MINHFLLITDARLFMWHDSYLQTTLDCSKMLPSSESLSSMDTSAMDSSPHFITALELLDLSGDGVREREQLLVGTNRGMILVLNIRMNEVGQEEAEGNDLIYLTRYPFEIQIWCPKLFRSLTIRIKPLGISGKLAGI